MILAVDSSALALMINPAANPPDDPATQRPVTNARERIDLLVASLGAGDTVIIPTPALAEILVIAGEGGPQVLEAITGRARLKVKPFGEKAAIETALMTREALQRGNKRGDSDAPWQKVKVDRQIIAVARAEGASKLYADDRKLVAFARSLGMDVFSTWDLPQPEVKTDLFTLAGVPTDEASDPDSPIERELKQGASAED